MNWQQLNTATEYPTSSQGNLMAPLPQLAIIQVSGEEAIPFLQNLLTNDLRTLRNNQAQLSGLCNPKGRLFAVFQLVKRDEKTVWLILPTDLVDVISQRLNLFKLRSKVDIRVAEEQVIAGWITPQTTLALPTETGDALEQQSLLIIRQPGDVERYLLIGDKQTAHFPEAIAVDAAYWWQYSISAGIPMVFNDSKERFTPQQLNMDRINGVSFKKGCYPGQEVVARLHYLGTPSRRMFFAQLDGEHHIAPYSEVTDNDLEIQGHVVMAQAIAHQTLCLISIKLSASEQALQIQGQAISHYTALASEE